MTIRATIIMSLPDATWTETHYTDVGETIEDPAVVAAAAALGTARARLLGVGARIRRIRLSDTAVPRGADSVPDNMYLHSGPYGGEADIFVYASDIPNVSLICRCMSTGGVFSKNLYLAGIPEGVVTTEFDQPGDFLMLTDFIAPFNSYVNLLKTIWKFRVQGAGLATQPVLQVVTSAQFPQTVGLVTPAAMAGSPAPVGGVVPPFECVVTKFRRGNTRVPGLSGRYQVVGTILPVAPATTYTYFLQGTGDVAISNLTKMGRVVAQGFSYVPYGNIVPTAGATHKRGVRTGARLGRLPSRR